MEGPSKIYGKFHPGCETEYWKKHPKEYKKMQTQMKVIFTNAFKGMGDDLRKDREERNRKIKANEANDKQYVQKIIRRHLDYSNNLIEIYKDPIKRRNYIIGLLASSDIKFTLENYKKFSNLNHLLKYYENRYNKTIYNGTGDEYKNALKLPSQYQFLPQGRMPYIKDINSYNAIVKTHHANLDIINKVFNSKANSIEKTLKKFEIFKTLDIPISKFQEANSYSNFLKLYNKSKKKSIIDFRELSTNTNAIETQEISILTDSFNLEFNKDHDIWNYFFGEIKNHQSLSLYKKEKIVYDNIINYVSVFGKDYKEISPRMKTILEYEDPLLSKENSYQAGGIKNSLPEYWSFDNTLLRPIVRFKLFKDFAMVYNFLIVDHENALREKKPVTRKKNNKITLSFSEYLKDEDEYIRKLEYNKSYIGLNNKLASLKFTETQGRYPGYIKNGTLIYEVIEDYNNQPSQVDGYPRGRTGTMIFNGDNILRDQRELSKKKKILADLYEVLNPIIKRGRYKRDHLLDYLLGYNTTKETFISYWDFSSFPNESKEMILSYLKSISINRRGERVNDYVPNRIWKIANFHNLFPYNEIIKSVFHSGFLNEILIVSSELKKRKFRTEGEKNDYNKRISESIKISDLKLFLGDTKNNELESNGEAISYFIQKTQNISEFILSFRKGIKIPEITTDIDITFSNNLETYLKGLNLFVRTLTLSKEHEALIKNYDLELRKTKKRKKIAIFNLSTKNNTRRN
jgi:hypothetical protein